MEELDLKELLRYYISNLMYVIFAIVITVSLGSAYNLITREPMYQSNVTIVLAGGSTQGTTTTNDLTLNKNLTKTYSKIIKSRKVLGQVIKDNNLDYTLDELSNLITVTNEDDTEIIKIIVSSTNNEEAAYIANAIVPVFTEEVERIYEIENVSVVDEAIPDDEPYNINVLKESIIFALIGIILSSGIIFIIYYFDTSIKSSETLQNKYNLNVLGEVPETDKE